MFTIRLPRGRTHLAGAELAPEDEADLLRAIGDPLPDPASRTGPITADAVGASPPGRLIEELHVEPARPAASSAEPGLPAGLDPGTDVTTILVADDNAEVRAYVRAHLERRYRVMEATDGREALEVARRALPDLVVSDVMMPRMDGFDLCRALKSDPETDYIPVLLLTARASSDSKIEGLQEGADDYLTKPFNVRELEVRVDNLIASRRRLRERFAAAAGAEKASVDDGGAALSPRSGADDALRAYTISITPGIVGVASADAAFLDQVRAAIEARLGDEDFDSDALARAVGAGRTTLYRRLKDLLGQSPMGLIRRMRLEHAALLLERGDGAIGEIAYAVGFRSVAHFSSSFKEQYGATPSAYRQSPRDPRADA
jgi:CheY-like chemotaxis protein